MPTAQVQSRHVSSEQTKEIQRLDQVDEFLKSAEIPDLFSALKSGVAQNSSQLEVLNGIYEGTATFCRS